MDDDCEPELLATSSWYPRVVSITPALATAAQDDSRLAEDRLKGQGAMDRAIGSGKKATSLNRQL